MSRTALLISGRASRVEQDYPSIRKHIIEPYEADVFIHTWCGEEGEKAVQIYQPVAYELEEAYENEALKDIKQFVDSNTYPYRSYDGQWARHNNKETPLIMNYKIWKCNQLKNKYETEKNIQYDRVIRFRLEITMNEWESVETIEPNTIYLPDYGDYMGGYCDQIAIGDGNAMNVYSSIYPQYRELAAKHYPFHPESLIRKHIEESGLAVKRFHARWHLRGKPLP